MSRPLDKLLHPSLSRLLRHQTQARLRRMLRGFSTPRRLVLSSLALVLAVVWLGNAAMSILFREPADLQKLQRMVPLGLLIYALWHVVKVAYERPEEGIEWSAAEREFLAAAPLRRQDLLAYRLASVFGSALLKATCFCLLLLPDLPVPLAAFAGTLLALLFVDLWRMVVEITAWGISRRGYRRYRAVVVLLAVAASTSAFVTALLAPGAWQHGESTAALELLTRFARSAVELRETWIGRLLESPMLVFGNVITAQQMSPALWGWLAIALAMVAAMAWLVNRLDDYYLRITALREMREYDGRAARSFTRSRRVESAVRLPRVPSWSGIGTIAWRQAIGTQQHFTGLLLALAPPTVLACMPLAVCESPGVALLNVSGALVFYSFLLLPSALKFDFRRDVDRMAILKALPIRASAIALGQIATPIVIATTFQLVVLLITWVVRPLHPLYPLAVLLLLVPLNVLIFSLDNLIYLLYPYRLNQEGLEIFLRTTLTFTAKGLIFTAALVFVWAGAMLAGAIARAHASSAILGNSRILFSVGGWCAVCLAATATTWLLVRAYERFDPSQDTPA